MEWRVSGIVRQAPWVAMEQCYELKAVAYLIITWSVIPELVVQSMTPLFGHATEAARYLYDVLFVAEALAQMNLRSAPSLAELPVIFLCAYTLVSCYCLAFDYNGFYLLAIANLLLFTLALSLAYWWHNELEDTPAGRFTLSRPREYVYAPAYGLSESAAPPCFMITEALCPESRLDLREMRIFREGDFEAPAHQE